jgi:hypothetical protein
MPTFTRDQANRIKCHIFQTVLGQEADGPIERSLHKNMLDNIQAISTMTRDVICSLNYDTVVGTDTSTKDLNPGQRGILTSLQDFLTSVAKKKGSSLSFDEYLAMTSDDYDDFRTDPSYMPTAQTGTAVMPPSQSSNSHTRDPVTDFKRGIKRDVNLFPRLKTDKGWDSWKRTVVTQARMQDVSEVLDPTYVPSTPTMRLLFDEKQKFMYAVFDTVLQNDQGKAYVRQYTDTFDAQKVYKLLCEYSTRSTKSSLDSTELLQYLTSTKLGDGKWKGSTHSFILNWQDQIRKYHDLVASTDKFPESIQRIMLENAVHHITDLRAVKSQASQIQTSTGNIITYANYSDLLISAAVMYDKQFEPKDRREPRGAQRIVYEHELLENEYDYTGIDDYAYNIDSEPHTLEVNFTRRSSSLTKAQWDRLPEGSQATWDTLSSEDKATILEPRGPRPPHLRRPQSQSGSTAISLHDISAHDYLQVNFHDQLTGSDMNTADHLKIEEASNSQSQNSANSGSEQTLLAHLTKRNPKSPLPPGHLQRMLSSTMAKGNASVNSGNDSTQVNEMTINGQTWTREVNAHETNTVYSVSASRTKRPGALVDRGANGGVAGEDVRVIQELHRTVDVQGIDNHQIVDIPIVIAGGVINTQRGPAIAILNQYAYIGKGKTIHSSGQLEWFGQDVNERSIKVANGSQRILTLDGYAIPINIRNGLPYITMRPYTDKEWNDLPHVLLTADTEWDPTVLDHDLDENDQWFDALSDIPEGTSDTLFDERGDYRHCTIVNHAITSDHEMKNNIELENHIIPTDHFLLEAYERSITSKEPDYEALRPNFAWQSTETVKSTFNATTQYAHIPMSTHLRKHYKSPNPAMNVHRRDEDIATDTVFSDTPAIDDGSMCAQIYIGMESQVCDAYGMKTDGQFVNTLQDNIRQRGAPTRLISDRAQAEISNKVKDILRALIIGAWQSEPHQQHQNPAERKYQTLKRMANTIIDRTGSPGYTWLLALSYICYVLNNTASTAPNSQTPITVLTGSTSDCSPLLRFHWWEEVYFKLDDSDFPSESPELKGHFVGISEHVGHAMTFKILSIDTLKVLHRGNVRSAGNPDSVNVRADELGGESATEIIKSRPKDERRSVTFKDSIPQNGEPVNDEESSTLPNGSMAIFNPHELIGRTFLMNPQEDGQRYRARIVEAVEDHQSKVNEQNDRVKFVCSINDEQYEEIMSYNDIISHIEKDEEDTIIWKFRRITAHEGPIAPNHQNWKGSAYNVMIEWENGEITSEPLGIIAADDPVTCAIYARENDLLEQPGWKRFKGIAKRQKKMFRMANQAKLRSFRTAPRYMYGFEVPLHYAQAVKLDTRNGNTKWQDSTVLEMDQLDEYDVFTNLGRDGHPGDKYKKIRVHLIYAVKYDGRHKARLVADGHLTDVPVDSVYSGVVSLRGLRMLIFLAELNGLETWATDIGNAYLEAKTSELVFIVAGPEFGERQGHVLVIHKALYGLRSSGLRWHEKFSAVMRAIGFQPCKMEPDIWLRRNGNKYEYVAVYVDDLAFAMEDPNELVKLLVGKHKFKLKGTGSITFHLGCDFFRDESKVLCMAPRKYIEKVIDGYERMFGEKTQDERIIAPREGRSSRN